MRCPYCNGTGDLPTEQAHVGSLIMAARNAKRMTQADLAAVVGLSRAQIANIESGRSDFPLSRLRKMAEALGVPVKELIP
jgi:transcriptional regulator with XRE-family HTH domain